MYIAGADTVSQIVFNPNQSECGLADFVILVHFHLGDAPVP